MCQKFNTNKFIIKFTLEQATKAQRGGGQDV